MVVTQDIYSDCIESIRGFCILQHTLVVHLTQDLLRPGSDCLIVHFAASILYSCVVICQHV